MIPVVTPAEMYEIDAAAPEPVEVLIDRAGAAVARAALEMLGGAYGRRVVVFAGPGNNGADGRVAAQRLAERGASVRVVEALGSLEPVTDVDLVIDAAFGTGFRGEWSAPAVGAAMVLAVDVPTGLDAATGIAAPTTLRADVTVTFAAAKPGQLLNDGPDVVGELTVADIGLDVTGATMGIVLAEDVAAWLPARARTAHKWSHAVRVVAGSRGMTGAAHLAAASAQRAGAGMVTLSTPGVDATPPLEVVAKPVAATGWADDVLADLHRYHALVVGPGLGRDDEVVPAVVKTVAESVVPVVVDGDGLFALSWNDRGNPSFLTERELPTILTPHDGEYGLLMGGRPGPDRVAAARRLVDLSGAVVVLKGPSTVVAAPDGRMAFVTIGDQRLATAGTGDVLAGVIAGTVAAGARPFEAAAAGAWLHAEAGNVAGEHGLVASDLVAALPEVLGRCRR